MLVKCFTLEATSRLGISLMVIMCMCEFGISFLIMLLTFFMVGIIVLENTTPRFGTVPMCLMWTVWRERNSFIF